MDPNLNPYPPTLERLERAVLACAEDTLLVRLHLALPAGVPASCSIRMSPTEIHWRGAHVTRSGDDSADALLLAHLGHQDDDLFLTLDETEPAAWVKPVRSGRRTIAYGASCLLGLPPVVADPTLDPTTVRDTLRELHRGDAAAGTVTAAGIQIRGGRRLLALRRSQPA
jgi:hypothetical protein